MKKPKSFIEKANESFDKKANEISRELYEALDLIKDKINKHFSK